MRMALEARAWLADLLVAAGPSRPTQCTGWDTYAMAAHLVTRERKPLAGPGLVVPALHGVTERAEQSRRAAHPFAELVETFRSGPPRWHPTRLGPVDEATNLVEFFIHAEDVRRGDLTATDPAVSDPAASDSAVPDPAVPDPAVSDALWKSLRRTARLALRRVPVGVVLKRTDGPGTVVARRGEPAVTIAGPAGELLLYASGRREAAHITMDGDAKLIAAVEGARIGI
jgi:uncharacterized protein (TIGR03085 family)